MSVVSLDQIPLNGGGKIKPFTGFSFSALLGDKHTSIFVKCQVLALWFVIILFVIICIIGHCKNKHRSSYKKMNPLDKVLESASEGFHILSK